MVQPPPLEGDPTLATEILPGPPPLVSIQQMGIPKKDHKKSMVVASYLPASDPGTTYGANSVSTMAITTEVDGPRRKRARLDKGYVLILTIQSSCSRSTFSSNLSLLCPRMQNFWRRRCSSCLPLPTSGRLATVVCQLISPALRLRGHNVHQLATWLQRARRQMHQPRRP